MALDVRRVQSPEKASVQRCQHDAPHALQNKRALVNALRLGHLRALSHELTCCALRVRMQSPYAPPGAVVEIGAAGSTPKETGTKIHERPPSPKVHTLQARSKTIVDGLNRSGIVARANHS